MDIYEFDKMVEALYGSSEIDFDVLMGELDNCDTHMGILHHED